MMRKTHTINATDRILGRLATEIAILLRGKHRSDFSPNKDIGDFVQVTNIDKIKFSGKKISQKKYWHHSGFPGGIKFQTLKELFEKNPKEVLKKAVWGMLPKNKLRAKTIKRLSFV